MSIYNKNFKGIQTVPTSDDIMDLMLTVIDNVMRNLHVASLGIITKVNTNTANVRIIPTNENESEKEIEVSNACGISLDPSDKVIVLYLDKDFRQNLNQIIGGQESNLSKNTNKENHNEKFGIIISKLSI